MHSLPTMGQRLSATLPAEAGSRGVYPKNSTTRKAMGLFSGKADEEARWIE